jgi:hypothetical protein
MTQFTGAYRTEDASWRQRLAVFSVALGTFTLVTNEFLPVALLTGIRTSLGVPGRRRHDGHGPGGGRRHSLARAGGGSRMA